MRDTYVLLLVTRMCYSLLHIGEPEVSSVRYYKATINRMG